MWKQYFKLPFEQTYSKVFDKDYHMVFDFMNPYFNFENKLIVSDSDKQKIIDCINGNLKFKSETNIFTFDSEQGLILLNNQPIMLLRGWGYLTGIGGCKLDSDKAVEVQNSLGEYIISKLNER
jgi:hypothetical protein